MSSEEEKAIEAKMELFKSDLLALMERHGVGICIAYGEYNYNGISSVYFYDKSRTGWGKTLGALSIETNFDCEDAGGVSVSRWNGDR